MRQAVFALALCASPAVADGYSDHSAVQMFTDGLCRDVVAAIDWTETAVPEAIILERGLNGLTQDIALSGMAWGMLLGIDLERGGLHTPGQTTLERLREACAANPDQTAKAILDALPVE